jgi:hypothetical protein
VTITIDLPDSARRQLAEVGIDAEQAGRFVLAELVNAAARAQSDSRSVSVWWSALSEAGRDSERIRTLASLSGADNGRSRSLEDATDRIRRRNNPGSQP